jgi:hypothetical protein
MGENDPGRSSTSGELWTTKGRTQTSKHTPRSPTPPTSLHCAAALLECLKSKRLHTHAPFHPRRASQRAVGAPLRRRPYHAPGRRVLARRGARNGPAEPLRTHGRHRLAPDAIASGIRAHHRALAREGVHKPCHLCFAGKLRVTPTRRTWCKLRGSSGWLAASGWPAASPLQGRGRCFARQRESEPADAPRCPPPPRHPTCAMPGCVYNNRYHKPCIRYRNRV